jgi:hypothetical protein
MVEPGRQSPNALRVVQWRGVNRRELQRKAQAWADVLESPCQRGSWQRRGGSRGVKRGRGRGSSGGMRVNMMADSGQGTKKVHTQLHMRSSPACFAHADACII